MGIPRIGFARRLLVLYGIIFILALLVTDWTLSHFLQKRDFLELQSSLTRQSVLIRELAIPLLDDNKRLQEQIRKIAAETGIRVTIIDPKGAVLADSSENLEQLSKMENHALRPEVAAALRKETGMSIRYSMTLEARMLYIAVPILINFRESEIGAVQTTISEKKSKVWPVPVLNHGKVLGVVRTAMPIMRVDEILASVRRPVTLTAILGILIVLIAGILFSNHLTKRIRRITSVAESYAREDWSQKILIDGRDELKMLANTMNQMATALRSRIEDLETEKGKISVILGHMNEGVIAVDRHKQIAIMNPTAEKIFECHALAIQGKSLIEVTRHPHIERIVDQAFREQKTVSEEIQTSGEIRKTLHLSVVVLKEHARDIGGILVFHDITELRRLENIRKEFVSNVSHELRTPLTAIKGFIETLLSGTLKDPSEGERFLRIIAEETDRLGRLVEDILALGAIEQKIALMKKDRIDLIPKLVVILEQFKDRIEKDKLSVENRISGKSLIVPGDGDRVHQVFVNLIDNAIKFNRPGGKIVLSADQKPEGVTITIEDTGIGIPEEAKSRIFERFFRADKAHSRELGGTGLGLAIVKHIMETHGGHVTCQSSPGQGSRFSVFFPA
ncbi:MAG: ATP-binding protein [Candidatus Omnitrophota bacterium]|jgi:two-component system phosphate regulon sensor histidine kinase PhoR